MLKFIHFSDSHLGFSDLDLTDEEGKNIREEDVYNAFSQAVDIILREKPDFALHTGDLFHRASPSNRSLITALEQINRIAEAGIPFYIIAGNHDYPKTIYTPAIHELYKLNGKVTICNGENLEVIEKDKYILHLLPHINSDTVFKQEVAKIKPNKGIKPNIFATHLTLGAYFMEELGERVFPTENLSVLKEFDYVALGHWHKFQHLKEYGNVYYAGATERTAESQTGYDMGVVRVTIGDSTKAELIALPLRPYCVINIDDCAGKTKIEIMSEIKNSLDGTSIKEGIFRINLNDLSQAQTYELTRDEIAELVSGALSFRVLKRVKESDETITIDSENFDLKAGFLEELNSVIKGSDFEKMKKQFEELWNELEEEEADANS